MARSWWLRCEVLPGPFDTERVVVLHEMTHGSTLQIIVDSGLVQSDEPPRQDRPVAGRVRVLRSGEVSGRANVLLPVPSQEFGSIIAVPPAELVAVG
jgi:hypothetical protein